MENESMLSIGKAKSSKKPELKFEILFVTIIRPLFCEFLASFLHTFWGCMVYKKPILPRCTEDLINKTQEVPNCNENYVISAFIPALQAGIAVWMITVLFHRITFIQFNPIMSMSFAIVGLLPWKLLVPTVIFQLAGASTGAFLAKILKQTDIELFSIPDNTDIPTTISCEILNTGIMVMFVLAITKNSMYDQPTGPMAMGFSVFQAILTSSVIGVTCLNPARAFGPALVTGYWKDHWVWWFGPGVGSISFTILYMFCLAENSDSWLIRIYQNVFHQKGELKLNTRIDQDTGNGI